MPRLKKVSDKKMPKTIQSIDGSSQGASSSGYPAFYPPSPESMLEIFIGYLFNYKDYIGCNTNKKYTRTYNINTFFRDTSDGARAHTYTYTRINTIKLTARLFSEDELSPMHRKDHSGEHRVPQHLGLGSN